MKCHRDLYLSNTFQYFLCPTSPLLAVLILRNTPTTPPYTVKPHILATLADFSRKIRTSYLEALYFIKRVNKQPRNLITVQNNPIQWYPTVKCLEIYHGSKLLFHRHIENTTNKSIYPPIAWYSKLNTLNKLRLYKPLVTHLSLA